MLRPNVQLSWLFIEGERSIRRFREHCAPGLAPGLADPWANRMYFQYHLQVLTRPTSALRSWRRPAVPGTLEELQQSCQLLDREHVTTPALDGSCRPSHVSPGRYTIVGWHELTDGQSAEIRIDAGTVTAIDLSVRAQNPT